MLLEKCKYVGETKEHLVGGWGCHGQSRNYQHSHVFKITSLLWQGAAGASFWPQK